MTAAAANAINPAADTHHHPRAIRREKTIV